MLSLNLLIPCYTISSSKSFKNSTTFSLSRFSKFFIRACYTSSEVSDSDNPIKTISNFSGFKLEDSVDIKSGRLRLDSWISSRISGISRSRVQSSIRSGLVSVNGRTIDKVAHMVREGDKVKCTIEELQPLRADPEDIPLDIVYEDAHVLVVNKPAHMVVHPAPGNATGTLVNGILHHCSLPTVSFADQELLSGEEDASDDEFSSLVMNKSFYGDTGDGVEASVRPGIVHRLDKGTSGLLVVAKVNPAFEF